MYNDWAVPAYYPDIDETEAPCNVYNTIPCSNPTASPNLYIDVNGLKKPNRATRSASQPRDQYAAQIYNTKVIPWGDASQEIMYDKLVSTEDNS